MRKACIYDCITILHFQLGACTLSLLFMHKNVLLQVQEQ